MWLEIKNFFFFFLLGRLADLSRRSTKSHAFHWLQHEYMLSIGVSCRCPKTYPVRNGIVFLSLKCALTPVSLVFFKNMYVYILACRFVFENVGLAFCFILLQSFLFLPQPDLFVAKPLNSVFLDKCSETCRTFCC